MQGLAEAVTAIRNHREESLPKVAIAYTAVSGKYAGGVPERETRLEVKGGGEATLFRRRPGADTPALPPGLFRGTVSPDAVLDFLDRVAKSGIDSFRGEPPSPRDLQRRLQVFADGGIFTFQWGPMPPTEPPAIKDMLRVLSAWESSACPDPSWRLELKVVKAESVSGLLNARVQVENTGPETIHLAHPASRADRSLLAVNLRYGARPPSNPDETPLPVSLNFTKAVIPLLDGLKLVPVKPGSSMVLDVEFPLERLEAGQPIGMLSLETYLIADTLAGVPVFSGAIFSEEFSW